MTATNTEKGWLVNPARKERRDSANTFTDEHAKELIQNIQNHPKYISKYLIEQQPELVDLVKKRDIAIICIGTIFFKRAGEILGLRIKDVYFNDYELQVTFNIEKKRKRKKYCASCGQKNGIKAKFCKHCTASLKDVPIITNSEPVRVTKHKTIENQFVPFIIEWHQQLEALTDNQEAWFFPPLQVVFDKSYFDFTRERIDSKTGEPAKTGMTVQNLDRILQRLDPTLTSSMFRYGGAEKYLNMGFTPFELKQIGDWSSSKMPEIYAERKGITPAQRRWSKNKL